VEQTAATGVLGGEPARANGFLVLRAAADEARSTMSHDPTESLPGRHELPAPKDRLLLEGGDVMLSWCSGGGGIGDPLLRDPGRVCDDVENGLVSPDRAAQDYGVIVSPADGSWAVDVDGTTQRRLQMRRIRLKGRQPVAVRERPPGGRRISEGLIHAPTALSHPSPDRQGVIVCRYCGGQLGPADQNIKSRLVLRESPAGYRWPLTGRQPGSEHFVVRHFYCPHCATQLDVEVNLRGAPLLYSTEILPTTKDRAFQ
jgi:N-methylhydantoinase B